MRLLLAILFTCTALSTLAQKRLLLPYKSGDLWGYADITGNMVLEPMYTHAGLMENGKAYVQLPERTEYFLIDSQGNYLESYSPHQFQNPWKYETLFPDLYEGYLFRDSLLYSGDSGLIAFLLQAPIKKRGDDDSYYLYNHRQEVQRWKSKDYHIKNPEQISLVQAHESWFYVLGAIGYPDGKIIVRFADTQHIRTTSLEDAYSIGLISLEHPIATIRWSNRPLKSLKRKSKWYLIDRSTGERLCRAKYDSIYYFKEGIACASLKKPRPVSWHPPHKPKGKYVLINSEAERISKVFDYPVEHLGNNALIVNKGVFEKQISTYDGIPISKRFYDSVSLVTDWCIQANKGDSFILFRFDNGQWLETVKGVKDRYGRGLPVIRTSLTRHPVIVIKDPYKDSIKILKQSGVLSNSHSTYLSFYGYKNNEGHFSYDGKLLSPDPEARIHLCKNGYYQVNGILHHIDSLSALTKKAYSSSLVDAEQNCYWVRDNGRWDLFDLRNLERLSEGRPTSGHTKPQHLGNGIYRVLHKGHYYYINKKGLWYWE